MKRTRAALLIVGGGLLLVLVAAATFFYVKVYRPIGSPLMAMAGGKSLEERRLRNHAEFLPTSSEVTADQAARFVAVEEEVQKRLADGIAVLARNQADLERASESHTLSVADALRAFRDIKAIYLDAKVVQIEAMNRANFSKEEFEWVRKQLYSGAGLRLTQLDVSDVLAGLPDATVVVRRFEARQADAHNQRLELPNAATLEKWAALGFFGL